MFTRDRRTDGSEETSEDVRFPYARAYGREDAPVRATCWRAYACELHQEVLERFLDPIVEVGPHGRSRTLRTPSVGDPKGPTPRPVDATNAPTTPHFPQSQSLFPVQRKSAVDWIGCEAHRVRLASSAAPSSGSTFRLWRWFLFRSTHARTHAERHVPSVCSASTSSFPTVSFRRPLPACIAFPLVPFARRPPHLHPIGIAPHGSHVCFARAFVSTHLFSLFSGRSSLRSRSQLCGSPGGANARSDFKRHASRFVSTPSPLPDTATQRVSERERERGRTWTTGRYRYSRESYRWEGGRGSWGVLGEGRKGGKWTSPHGQTSMERTSRGDLLDQIASRNILEETG